MIPKIRRDLQQIADMCGVQERVGVSRTPRYRKDETRLIDEPKRESHQTCTERETYGEKIIYFDFEEFSCSRWEVSQKEIESRSR